MRTVSLITPCYNGEKYLDAFFDGLLRQTYTDVELFFVDDGSTDLTKKKYQSYEERLLKRGYDLKYFYQKNEGQASAINSVLDRVNGEYLMWPDSDDVMYPNHIEEKVKAMKANKKTDLVMCEGIIVCEDNIEGKGKVLRRKRTLHDDLFADYIYERNVVFAPMAFMVRMSSFDKVNPQRKIYCGRQGQNWQLLLPLIYSGKWNYINKQLYRYVVRNKSHSHEERSFLETIDRLDGFKQILLHTIRAIDKMPLKEKQWWEKQIEIKYLRKKLYLYQLHSCWEETIILKNKIRGINGRLSIKEMNMFINVRNRIFGDLV